MKVKNFFIQSYNKKQKTKYINNFNLKCKRLRLLQIIISSFYFYPNITSKFFKNYNSIEIIINDIIVLNSKNEIKSKYNKKMIVLGVISILDNAVNCSLNSESFKQILQFLILLMKKNFKKHEIILHNTKKNEMLEEIEENKKKIDENLFNLSIEDVNYDFNYSHLVLSKEVI